MSFLTMAGDDISYGLKMLFLGIHTADVICVRCFCVTSISNNTGFAFITRYGSHTQHSQKV